MEAILYIIAGPVFLISLAGHLYVKFCLRPKEDSDLDEYHYEFEHMCPGYARYEKWSKITFTTAAIAALLLFIAIAL